MAHCNKNARPTSRTSAAGFTPSKPGPTRAERTTRKDVGDVSYTNSYAAFLLMAENNGRYSFDSAGASSADSVACYRLSDPPSPAMGDGYWSGEADVYFDVGATAEATRATIQSLQERASGA